MNEQQARERGYQIVRGAYHGTSDDRADRWYIQSLTSATVDRRGKGFAGKDEALARLADDLALQDEG